MVTHSIAHEQIWNSLQEPRCPSYFPGGYLLLLSALDNGWKVTRIEVQPSWDQYGFIYLLTLKHPARSHHQKLVLPKNPQVENLLLEYKVTLLASQTPLRLQA